MDKDQNRVPLIEALDRFIETEPALFCIPGHRSEKGVPEELLERFGEYIFRYDLTEAPGLDDLHDAQGAIREAEELLAGLFGADRSWFIVNGTTAAAEAMIMAAAGPGEEIIIARNIHKSALSGLVISGAVPVWLECEYDDEWHIAGGITAASVEKKIQEHPGAKAVYLVSPTYYGVNSDLKAIAEVCHRYGIPLLVDAAHGSHFRFSELFPEDAVSAGADLCAMSFHKTAGAMTQASVLHYRALRETVPANAGGQPDDGGAEDASPEEMTAGDETAGCGKKEIKRDLTDIGKLEAALKITQSSSPSYILMASLDAARKQLAMNGRQLAEKAAGLAYDLRRALEQTPGVKVFGGSDAGELLSSGLDPARVVFRADGIDGITLKERLFEDGQSVLEMADAQNAVAVITAGNTSEDILKLSMAVWSALSGAEAESGRHGADFSRIPEAVLTPREAFFAPKEKIALREAEGRICGSYICPYPPGTPAVIPGEVISGEIMDIIEFCRACNIPMHGIGNDGIIEVIR